MAIHLLTEDAPKRRPFRLTVVCGATISPDGDFPVSALQCVTADPLFVTCKECSKHHRAAVEAGQKCPDKAVLEKMARQEIEDHDIEQSFKAGVIDRAERDRRYQENR